ncbi:BRO1 domain-containing protein BROX [Lepeophtheirus salmonis]|uniref:BRO1 domain-containing protein BROX n=1 Tax=Lepeophtheirus salmonis TaxID=72036 RepID=A0A7R8D3S1_LEPSM|nr:BRO1 domain-containing protein BROX [Lepeophtheirus salmonis]CAF3016918.1 BRO1 domain-containing protein BROX [Lepeophtheirus salmonis]
MAYWFHRNPLKGSVANFGPLELIVSDEDSIKIKSDLKRSRDRIVELIPDPHHELELEGLQKLRHSLSFKWSQSCVPKGPSASQKDAVFEMGHLLVNVAIWHMKRASMLASKDDLQMEEAKEIHTSLRRGAGYLVFVQDVLIPQFVEKPDSETDLDPKVIVAYLNQCMAEAQEVTMARAIELKHNAALITTLAHETFKMYTTAGDAIEHLDKNKFGRWSAYLKFKSMFYQAYAFNYQGESLLAQDKCGDAIRSLREAQKNYEEAINQAKEYCQVKGPGTNAKPHQHLFFKKLGPIINRTLEKCERENSLIYHEKVPYDPIALEEKRQGLWPIPSVEDKKGKSKSEEEIKPIKEVEIKNSEKDPINESGCIIA